MDKKILVVISWLHSICLAANLSQLFPNPVIARGKGFEIQKQELENRVNSFVATLAAEGHTLPPEELPLVKHDFLNRIILSFILKQKATIEDQKIAQELAKQLINEAKQKAGSEEAYKRRLLALGMKPEEFESRAYEQALVEQIIKRELGGKVQITDQEIKEFYEEGIDPRVRKLQSNQKQLNEKDNPQQYQALQNQINQLRKANLAFLERPLIIKTQIIVLFTIDRFTQQPLEDHVKKSKLELAKSIVAKLKSGEPFEELALKYSEALDVTSTKGVYTVSEYTSMPQNVKAFLLAAEKDHLSEVIETPIGYYIVKIVERTPRGKISFEEALPLIREELLRQKIEAMLPAFIEQLFKEYNVEVLPEAFK